MAEVRDGCIGIATTATAACEHVGAAFSLILEENVARSGRAAEGARAGRELERRSTGRAGPGRTAESGPKAKR